MKKNHIIIVFFENRGDTTEIRWKGTNDKEELCGLFARGANRLIDLIEEEQEQDNILNSAKAIINNKDHEL